MIPVALTIAGPDTSGGAGLQADLKTFHQHGVYGTSVVTLLTVQDTQAVSAVEFFTVTLSSRSSTGSWSIFLPTRPRREDLETPPSSKRSPSARSRFLFR